MQQETPMEYTQFPNAFFLSLFCKTHWTQYAFAADANLLLKLYIAIYTLQEVRTFSFILC